MRCPGRRRSHQVEAQRRLITKSGEVITEEIADELAREAEGGYDIDPSHARHGPGRKSLAEPDVHPARDQPAP